MKSIIIPTDFSPNANNAIRYAVELDKHIHAKIILFHSYLVFVDASNLLNPTQDEEELKKSSEKSLLKLKDEILNNNIKLHSEIETIVTGGEFNHELISISSKNKADLIIMGTTGASGLKEVFLGTNTSNIIEKSKCPVLAIPSEAKFKGINKIVFATNYADNDFEHVHYVIDFAKNFNAEVIMVHISEGEPSKSYLFKSIEEFFQKVKKENNYDKLSFKLIDNKDVENGINTFLEEISADIVAMTTHNRSMFQKLFDHSVTRKMAFHSHIPLMVFHVKERSSFLL